PRPLRRPGLARLPSSRDAVHRRLRVPHRREEPLFPLGACWGTQTTHTQNSREVPPARRPRFVTQGIILPLSPRSASPSHATSSTSFQVALFAARYVYNTVVLAACGVRRDKPAWSSE